MYPLTIPTACEIRSPTIQPPTALHPSRELSAAAAVAAVAVLARERKREQDAGDETPLMTYLPTSR